MLTGSKEKKETKTNNRFFMLIATTGIILSVFLVGYYVIIEQDTQLQEWMDEHPGETPDFGGPPRLDLMVATIIPLAIAIAIILKLSPKEDNR